MDGKGRSQRQSVVEWLCSVGVEVELRRSTIYRAVFYFDAMCSAKGAGRSHLELKAAAALLVAAKWNEKEERVPTLRRLGRTLPTQYAVGSLRTMELNVLNLLRFELKVVLPLDFVQWAIGRGAVWPDDTLHGQRRPLPLHRHQHSKLYLLKFALFFLDVAVQSYSFHQHPPSIMAFAVIVASRRALNIVPYFNPKLPALCHHPPAAVRPCFVALWKLYALKFPKDAANATAIQPDLF